MARIAFMFVVILFACVGGMVGYSFATPPKPRLGTATAYQRFAVVTMRATSDGKPVTVGSWLVCPDKTVKIIPAADTAQLTQIMDGQRVILPTTWSLWDDRMVFGTGPSTMAMGLHTKLWYEEVKGWREKIEYTAVQFYAVP